MNHFEYGFLDEFEKIATNKALVAEWAKWFRKQFPGASKGDIGRMAMMEAQNLEGTWREGGVYKYRHKAKNIDVPLDPVHTAKIRARSRSKWTKIPQFDDPQPYPMPVMHYRYLKAPDRLAYDIVPSGWEERVKDPLWRRRHIYHTEPLEPKPPEPKPPVMADPYGGATPAVRRAFKNKPKLPRYGK